MNYTGLCTKKKNCKIIGSESVRVCDVYGYGYIYVYMLNLTKHCKRAL